MQNTQGKVAVGISFPEYFKNDKHGFLGTKSRLFAENEQTLCKLDLPRWMVRLTDYVHCTSIRPVPEKVNAYAVYQRCHPKANIERLARRYAKRNGLLQEEAVSRYVNFKKDPCDLPYVRLKSLTNSHPFHLFIEKKVVNVLTNRGFGTYGLSPDSSVPEF